MTDRVIEIRLRAPRPNLLRCSPSPSSRSSAAAPGRARSVRRRPRRGRAWPHPRASVAGRRGRPARGSAACRRARREQRFRPSPPAMPTWCSAAPLPTCPCAGCEAAARVLSFDPASGLFGLVPVRPGGLLDDLEVRRLLSQAIDRDALTDALAGAGPRGAGDGARARRSTACPRPLSPTWLATPLADRRPALIAEAHRSSVARSRPSVFLPDGPGSSCCSTGWPPTGARSAHGRARDRARRCRFQARRRGCAVDLAGVVPAPVPLRSVAGLRSQTDELLDAARDTPVPRSAAPCSRRRRRRSTMPSCLFRSPRRFAGRWFRGGSRASPGTATPATR